MWRGVNSTKWPEDSSHEMLNGWILIACGIEFPLKSTYLTSSNKSHRRKSQCYFHMACLTAALVRYWKKSRVSVENKKENKIRISCFLGWNELWCVICLKKKIQRRQSKRKSKRRGKTLCVSGYRHDHILTLPVLYSSLRQVEGIGRPKHCSGQIKSLTPTHQCSRQNRH